MHEYISFLFLLIAHICISTSRITYSVSFGGEHRRIASSRISKREIRIDDTADLAYRKSFKNNDEDIEGGVDLRVRKDSGTISKSCRGKGTVVSAAFRDNA